ncbi:MAG: hypothetical protein L3J22_09535 [Xanthomonadales bacterium]|nr:hypothetical protein [Xanthomonadales bacterium]
MSQPLWFYPLLAFVLTLGLTPLAIYYSNKKKLLDYPGERRSHDRPIPRGGGVVAVLVLLLLCEYFLFSQWGALGGLGQVSFIAFIIAVFGLGVVGYRDDHASLSNTMKLTIQVLACAAVVLMLLAAAPAPKPATALLFFAFMAMLWLTNLYNFMDGSHGMAAGQAVFSGLLLAWFFKLNNIYPLTLLSLLLVAVSAGFIVWNFPRPRVFMGDVLSGVLGVAFSVLIVAGWLLYQLDLLLLSIVLATFVVDATLTLMARILSGQKWYNPHREHAYQRLVTGGYGHVGTWLIYQALNFLLVLPVFWLAQSGRINSFSAAVFVYLLFSLLWYAVYRNQRTNNKNNINEGH